MLEDDVREVRWQAGNNKFDPLGSQEKVRGVGKKVDAGRTNKKHFWNPDT
jgi:hypothetical protein